MIYLANLQMQMTCSDQPLFLVQNFAQLQERERISLLQDNATIF
jgi:hypothetical protein